MRKSLKLCGLLLVMIVIASIVPAAQAYSSSGSDGRASDDVILVDASGTEYIDYEVEGGTLRFQPSTSTIVDCSPNVTRADIPDEIDGCAVVKIGSSAFENNSNLQHVSLPNSIVEIEEGAFANCSSLTEIEIQDGTEKIGYRAFENCTGLETAILPGSIKELAADLFRSCTNLKNVTLGYGIEEIGSVVFGGCYRLNSIEIPESVSSIGERAFAACKNLESVRIPDSVEVIGKMAFAQCSNLKKITLPHGLDELSAGLFYECINLETVSIPDTVTSIQGSFPGCSKLKSIMIPDSVTTIGTGYVDTTGFNAFGGCESLSVAVIGRNVEEISYESFSGANLSAVYFKGDAPRGINNLFEFGYLDSQAVIYYANNTYGWNDVSWRGYKCLPYDPAAIDFDSILANAGKPSKPNDSDNPGSSSPGSSNESITLSRNSLSMTVGDSQTLTAAVETADGSGTVLWTSDDTSVAAVDADGQVTAVGAGKADITASVEGTDLEAVCHVTVKDAVQSPSAAVTGVTVEPGSVTLKAGEKRRLTATVQPSNADNKAVAWTSSNSAVASVSAAGEVSAKAAGSAVITATTEDGNFKDTCTVTVSRADSAVHVTGVTIEPDTLALKVGEIRQLAATVQPSNADNKAVIWSSSNSSVAVVSATGEVSAKAAGSAVITAATSEGNYKDICTVSVRAQTSSPAIPFRDVSTNQYYYSAVAWAYGRKLVSGVTDTAFAPDATCTRAEMVTILWRAAGSPEPASSAATFRDVPAGAWYTKAVAWAVERKITSGTSSTAFSPGAVLTRAQVAAFLYNYFGRPAVLSGNTFSDVPGNSWFSSAVQWAVINGVTNGTGGNAFSPNMPCSRGQTVTFLYRSIAD